MPSPGSAPYTPRRNNRTYTNTSDNYQDSYTTVAYIDPNPLPDNSDRLMPNYAYNNATWYNTYHLLEHIGIGYETHHYFH
jgi:hypothetical protein